MNENIGNRIKNLRVALGLSQSELARRLNVTPQAVQQWENGKNEPRGKRVDELAKELLSTKEFLYTGFKVADAKDADTAFMRTGVSEDAKEYASNSQAIKIADSTSEPHLKINDVVLYHRCTKSDIQTLTKERPRLVVFEVNGRFQVREVAYLHEQLVIINQKDVLTPYTPLENLPEEVAIFGVATKLIERDL